MGDSMKESRLNLRISEKRLNKLRNIAKCRDVTITQIVQDWIDSLVEPSTQEKENNNNKDDFKQYLNEVIKQAPIAYSLEAFDLDAAYNDKTLMILFSKQKKLKPESPSTFEFDRSIGYKEKEEEYIENLEAIHERTLEILEAKYLVAMSKPKNKYTLEELLEGVTPENSHGETNCGNPVGKEFW